MVHALTHVITRYPPLLAVFAVVAMLGSSFVGYKMWEQMQQFPAEPVHMTLSEALSQPRGSHSWVIIDDGAWDCTSLRYTPASDFTDTDALFTDASGTVKGIATFGRELSCDQLLKEPIRGVSSVRSSPSTGPYLSICTWCGQSNTRLGLYIAGGGFTIGLILAIAAARQMMRGNFF